MTSPYADHQPGQFWRSGVAAVSPEAFDPVLAMKFTISPTDPIAVAGAGFGQHIAGSLAECGFNYLVTEAPVSAAEPRFSARFGAINTTRQLRQLMLGAYGLLRPANRVWRRADGRYIDPFRPKLFPAGFATAAAVVDARRVHLAAVRRMLQECRVLLFTLGLTESWATADGAALPMHPALVNAETPEGDAVFANLPVADMRADLDAFLADLAAVNPAAKVILIVSPVPCVATHEPRHVLPANGYSKAALRVAAEETAAAHANVAYFPAYDIITAPQMRGGYFGANMREVTEEGVAHVMRLFSTHVLRAPQVPEAHEPGAAAAEGEVLAEAKVIEREEAPAAAMPAMSVASPPTGLPVEIDFRKGGQGHDLLVAGWSYPEPEYTWTLGTQSFIRLPVASLDCDCTLKFRAGPMVRLGALNFQRLRVEINDIVVANLVARQPAQYDILVPADVVRGRDSVQILFHMQDAATPAEVADSGDKRQLGFWMSSLRFEELLPGPQFQPTPAPPAEAPHSIAGAIDDKAVLMQVQSLGTNCELGFVQRRNGAEPLGLFRWAATPLPGLLQALEARFEGFGAAENVVVQEDGATEFQVIDRKFGFRNHSFAYARDGATEAGVRARELARLPFLARMMIEDLQHAEKLFCFQDAGHSGLDAIERLVAAIGAYGPNTLLWICPAARAPQRGTAERIHARLICAYVDQFQPIADVGEPTPESCAVWTAAVRAGWNVWRG